MIRRILRRIRPRVARYFRRRVIRRGRDRTSTIAAGRAVVLAPHPDDETVGCGVLIARKRAAGTEVQVVIATDGSAGLRARRMGSAALATLRRAEAIDACAALGVPAEAVHFLDFRDGQLEAERTALGERLTALLASIAPEEVYVPGVDEHPDHRTLAEVGRRAHADSGIEAALWEYPVRYWQRVPWVRASDGIGAGAYLFFAEPWREWRRPSAMLVQTEGFQEKKLAALNVYAGEMEAVGDKIRPFLRAGYEVFFPLRGRG